MNGKCNKIFSSSVLDGRELKNSGGGTSSLELVVVKTAYKSPEAL